MGEVVLDEVCAEEVTVLRLEAGSDEIGVEEDPDVGRFCPVGRIELASNSPGKRARSASTLEVLAPIVANH